MTDRDASKGVLRWRSGNAPLLVAGAEFILITMFREKFSRRFGVGTLIGILFMGFSLPAIGDDAEEEKGLFYYVVDRSGSIRAYGLTEPITEAISEHAAQLPENTEIRLVFFSRNASEPQQWEVMTPEAKTDFSEHFKENFIPDGPTRLYDTVGEVMEELRASEEDYRFVSILVFSDGENNWSRSYRSWQELEPLYNALAARHEQSFLYWVTLEFEPAEDPPPWVLHKPQAPGTTEIPIPEPPPVVSFRANPQQLKVGEPIQFEHVARGGRVNEFLWEFGDGTTSTEENPVHHYEEDGAYTVTLQVGGPGGEASEVKEEFVQVAPEIDLRAAFRFQTERARIGDTVQMQDVSEGNPDAWEWALDGEAISDEAGASFTAENAGESSVSLTVRRGDETDTVEQTITVLPPPPEAGFAIQPEEAKFGDTVTFSAEETADDWEHRWTIDGEIVLGGSHVEWVCERHGLLHVVHTVEGPGGFSRHTDRVFVHPPEEVVPETAFSVEPRMFTQGDTVVFRARETGEELEHEWYIDGDLMGEGSEWSWESDRTGNLLVTHRVRLLDTDDEFETSDEILGRRSDLVVVQFSMSETEGVYPLTVRFSDESEGAGVAYRWDFGDGNYSDERNPTHTYREAGDYPVVLSVTNRHGETTANVEPVVLSVAAPMPLWQKILIGLLIGAVVWVGLVVPLLVRPMLSPHKGAKLVGVKTYPLHIPAKKGWRRFFWPSNSVTIGSAAESDIRLPNPGGASRNFARIERTPATSSYSIRPLGENASIQRVEKPTSLTRPGGEERTPVGRGRVLRDGDVFEVSGERLTWCQPPKRRVARGKERSMGNAKKGRFAGGKKKQALARVRN